MLRADGRKVVVVTGLGIKSPLGNSVDSFFKSLLEVDSHFYLVDFLNLGVEIRASFFKNRSDYEEWDGGCTVSMLEYELLVEATLEALENARITCEGPVDCSIALIGTTTGGGRNRETLRDILIDQSQEFSYRANEFQSMYSVADYLGNRLKLINGARTLMSACSSGVHAIGYGKMLIQNGAASRVIVGGVDTISYTALLGFRSLGISPKEQVRPFDRERDGFYLGEGAAVLILESLDLALARNAPILAQVSGFGASGDGNGHITNPNKDGYVACMVRALQDSGVTPDSIDYINAHGTATPASDAAEAVAIKECFSDYARIPVSSIKSSTGHTLGASGAIGSLVCIKAINERVIPPNKNLDAPDEVCRGMFLPVEPQKCEPKNVLCNSFGFGGNNTSLVFSRFDG